MKRKITLLSIIVLATLSSFAFRGESRLHLNLFDDGNFTVVVDGQRYMDVRGKLLVTGLTPGTHRVRVVKHFHNRRGHRVDRNVLFVGNINVPFRSAVFAHLTNNNRLRVREIRRLPSPRYNRGRNHRNYGNRGYGNNGRDYNYRDGYGNRGNRGYHDGYGHRRGGTSNQGDVNRGPRGNRGNSFNYLKFTLKQTSFDKDRLRIAKQYANNQRLNSAEVAKIMDEFSFESSRLNFAKFAWHKVVDPQNYFNVNRAFSFSKSIRELDRYIVNNQ